MDRITYDLTWICSINALIVIVLLTSINMYLYIRKKFPVKVNCWFCNQWTKVRYVEKNSFDCPSCLQYNGFDINGDYNKILPAQYDIGLNKPIKTSKTTNSTYQTSGLCRLCNNNQQLRVFQLANFIPLHEDNFDVEIEHFQKQLDKAYKLCNHCENTVKTTVKRQNSLLGIKLSKLSQKGLSLLDFTQSSNGISIETKQSFLKRLVFYAIIAFALLNIVHIVSRYEFLKKNVNELVQKPLLPYFIKIQDFHFTAVNRIMRNFENNFTVAELPFIVEILLMLELIGDKLELFTLQSFSYVQSSLSLVYIVGALLQLIWLLLDRLARFTSCICMVFMWVTLLLLESGYWVVAPYEDTIKIVASCLIISLMYFARRVKSLKMKKTKMISRIHKKKVDDYLEHISVEEIRSVSKINKKIQPIFNNQPDPKLKQNAKSVCDVTRTVSGCENKHFANTANKFAVNNMDLEVSLNKLHIGSGLATEPISFKALSHSCIRPNVDRPRPVLSPAKLQNISSSWQSGGFTKDSSCVLLPSNGLFHHPRNESNYNQTRFNLNSQYNSICGGLEYNSFYSDPRTRLLGNHFNTCCPRFSCGNQLDAMYRPLINNEQLVYLSPNCLQSTRDVCEIFGQSDLFDASYSDKLVQSDKRFGSKADVFYN